MLSFSMSEEQNIMKETAAKLVKNNIIDAAHDMDENGAIPEELFQKVWDLGLSISMIPEEYGGYGLEYSPVMSAIVLEELAYGDMAYAIAATVPSLFLFPIVEMGTEEQKQKYLPLYCTEKFKPASLAVNEPNFSFDPIDLQTTAIKQNGSYILNGKKCFVPLAEQSGHILAAAALEG
ncbi:MAG: acyl-CoA dehydrogenase, partial [bacterium]|nr:acyl-CoA dehydrogenase [bacterium]